MKPEDYRSETVPGHLIRHPNGYWSYIPNPLPPNIVWSNDLISTLSRADRALGQLAGLGHALPNPRLLIKPFVRREAVLSSRIEGTQASLSDLYAYEMSQLSLFELPDDVKEVRNYVNTLEYGLKRLSSMPISSRLMRELHARLLDGVRGEQWTPGEFRRSPNWIGSPGSTLRTATYVPPPVREMHLALSELEKFIHQAAELPPLIRLSLIHYQFEAIHPFLDGNGRIGRLLNSLLLSDWQLLPQPILYLSAYFERHRQAYYDHLLAISQRGAWNEWFIYFLRGIESQAKDSIWRIQKLQTLRGKYRAIFQKTKVSVRVLRVIDWLFIQPVFTISKLGERLDVKYATAQRYVSLLEKASIIDEITGRTRNRVYRASEIVKTIERDFSG